MDVIFHLLDIPQARHPFGWGIGIEFEFYKARSNRLGWIRSAFIHSSEDRRSLSFVIKYKPSLKLLVKYLHAGLRHMHLWKEIVQRRTNPKDPGERLKYNADRFTGAAITQIFKYLIENGLEYSYKIK